MTTAEVVAPQAPYLLDHPSPVTFSVIVPAFESAGVIGAALASLLAQTRPPDEILVSDDGSSDDLEGALEPFAERLTVVRGANRGPAAARNRALAVATGDFVASLDADDEYLPGRLAALEAAALVRPDLDILATDVLFETDAREAGRFSEHIGFPADGQRSAVLDRCFVAVPAVRRTRLLAIGGFDESLRISEDWDVLIRLVLAGAAVGLVDEPLYRYRLRADSLTANRVESLRSRVRVLEALRSHPGLTRVERHELERSLDAKRRRVLRAEAELAVAELHPDARNRALALARAPGSTGRQRLSALTWAVSPSRGRRRLSEQHPTERASASPWSRSSQ
jgi:GT2 family glycosyltransferase